MADSEMLEADSYKAYLREWWKEITNLSIQFRDGMMLRDQNGKALGCDPDVARAYVSNMGRFWLELSPMVQGRSELKEIQTDFMKFKPYAADGSKFFIKRKPKPITNTATESKSDGIDDNELFQMEEVLRKVIDKLKITKV